MEFYGFYFIKTNILKSDSLVNLNIMSIDNESLMITCPACGYTFKLSEIKKPKDKVQCPACGYEFKKKPLRPEKPDKPDFDQPII